MPGAKKRIPSEAEIQAQIAADPDDFEATDAQLAAGRSFADTFPDLARDIARAWGRPRVANPKQLVSLRLDPDVIEKFKRAGKGWQQRINTILKRSKV